MLTPDQFRQSGHALIDWVADFRANIAQHPVMAQVQPGDIKAQLPGTPPQHGEPFEAILADMDRLIVPGKSTVDLGLQILDLACELRIAWDGISDADECTHDFNIDGDCSGTVQH